MATALPKIGDRLRFVWLGLLALNVILLLFALPGLLRGDIDRFNNEHARSVAGSLSGILLCSGGFAKSAKLKWSLLGAAFLSIGASFWLR